MAGLQETSRMNVNAPAQRMDVDEFMAFLETRPHGQHWELIDGGAVMAAPATDAHRRIAGNLCELLNSAFAARRRDLFVSCNVAVRTAAATTSVAGTSSLSALFVPRNCDPNFKRRF